MAVEFRIEGRRVVSASGQVCHEEPIPADVLHAVMEAEDKGRRVEFRGSFIGHRDNVFFGPWVELNR